MSRSPEPAAPADGIRPLHGSDHPDLAPRVAVVITTVVICGFFLVAVTYVLRAQHSAWTLVGCAAGLAGLLALQLTHSFPTLARPLARYRKWTLLTQAVLTYLPFTVFKAAWLGMPGFLAASTLLVLPGALAWTLFGAIAASVEVLQFAVGFGVGDLVYNGVSTVLTGFVVYGLSRLSDLIREVQAARGELARLAVTQERLRFARDLHDLLGYSLSTITLKCELTYRLVPRQPQRAQQELTEVLHTARQALSDVRSVATGYRSMSLRSEATAAESMLAAVGIEVDNVLECGPLPEAVDTVLATVLREGVTNMLRHSKAQRCRIEACRDRGTVRMSLVNDGVGGAIGTLGAAQGSGGSGIGNLTERVRALGGRLTAGTLTDHRFRLHVEVPLDGAESAAASAAASGGGHSQPD